MPSRAAGRRTSRVSNWIAGATAKHSGKFKAKAKAAGMSTGAYARKVEKAGSKASTTTKREAALAETLTRMRKRKRH